MELLEQSGAEPEALVDALVDGGYAMLRCGDDDVVDVLLRAATIARETGDRVRLARAVTVLCDMGPTSGAGAPDPVLVQLVDDALDGAGDPDTTARLAASASSLFSLSDWTRCRVLYERAVSCGTVSRAMADVLPFPASLALGGPDDLGRPAPRLPTRSTSSPTTTTTRSPGRRRSTSGSACRSNSVTRPSARRSSG